MLYLDEVFYVQYPSYHCPERQQRGWLFSILKRFPSAYHATLALSEHHLLSMQAQNSNITATLAPLRAKNGFHNLALQQIQATVEEAHKLDNRRRLMPTLGGLMSILQLLFYEVREPTLLETVINSILMLQCVSSLLEVKETGKHFSVQLVC